MEEAVEKARDLIATHQYQSQRCNEHAAAIVDVARALLSSSERVKELEVIASDLDKWERRYPASRIYSEGQTHKIAEELTAIVERARSLLPTPRKERAMTENSETELKPCPFCGRQMRLQEDRRYRHGFQRRGLLCAAEHLAVWADDPVAIAAWNRRPLPSEGRRAALEEAAKVVEAHIHMEKAANPILRRIVRVLRALISKE